MLKKILSTSLLFLSLSSSVKAEIINGSAYFKSLISAGNTTQTTTNTWQLGYLNSDGNFELFHYTSSDNVIGTGGDGVADFDGYDATNTAGLTTPFSDSYYGFGINVSGNDTTYFGNAIYANEIYAHPYDSIDGDVILRFFASSSGQYDFDTTIRRIDSGDVAVSVLKNGNNLLSSPHSTASGPLNFVQSLSLNAGETVDFEIDRIISWNSDGTAINANVTVAEVSEPGTLAILALGLLGLNLRCRKA